METSRKKILVAEDNDSNYLLIFSLLKKSYDIVRAINGLEAIEKLETENPDIILMDLKMPEMGGLEATKKIRETNKVVPIIALTAYAFESDRLSALEAGCNDFVAKPINHQQLIETLNLFNK